jgi:hypothetical protein
VLSRENKGRTRDSILGVFASLRDQALAQLYAIGLTPNVSEEDKAFTSDADLGAGLNGCERRPPMIYVLMLAVLWAAVGALVFFVRTSMSLPRRLELTIATSLVFGVVGWVDVSSIVRALQGGRSDRISRSRKQERGSLTWRRLVAVATDNRDPQGAPRHCRGCVKPLACPRG